METWFRKGLAAWYAQNKRDLPWRATTDPYKIWLSEVILQQTQVSQGLSYYTRFVGKFPTVSDLAHATEDQVLKLWQGLGYYSRARNLHHAAKTIASEHRGKFPMEYEAIKGLKGIGDYTAAAIASFAFDLPHAVVDGNVYRVLSRVFGIHSPIDEGTGRRHFQELADELLDKKQPAIHNQAIMEFGSQYCKPVSPDCAHCIFKTKCVALQENSVHLLPLKKKKVKVKKRYFNYILIADPQKNIQVSKRASKDIWKGLYEFSLIETKRDTSPNLLFNSQEYKEIMSRGFSLLYSSKRYKHVLTHQQLHARFYVIRTKKINGSRIVNLDTIDQLAFPRLIEKFLKDCNLEEIL
jgi:A/G-specific adenine glycosylase